MARKKKRIAPIPKLLDPTPEEIRRAEDMLHPFYLNNPDKLKGKQTVDDKISEIIDKAKVGYGYCPSTFIGRVIAISKVNVGIENVAWGKRDTFYNAREAHIQQTLEEKQDDLYPGFSAKELRKILTKDERKRWIERESYYRREFDLNNASDVPLLLQALTEEVIQYRLIMEKLSDQSKNLDRQMNESYARLNKALENLGITRRQRQSLTKETEGSIAHLTEILEAKKKKINAIEERDLQEERALSELRNSDDLLKHLPDDLKEITAKAMTSEDWS